LTFLVRRNKLNIVDKPEISIVGDSKSAEDQALLTKLETWLLDSERSVSETTWREKAKESYEFYAGDQDTPEVKASLELQGRPGAVFNEVKPKVDSLLGIADQIRQVPTVLPVGMEDEALAELLNGTFKHYRNAMGLSDLEMDCFEHGIKSGRSFLHFHIDSENPFEPEIKAKRMPGRDGFLDPDSIEYDLSDARYMFVNKWFDKTDILRYWPKFAAQINQMGQGNSSSDAPSYFDLARKKYRILEAWYREPETVIWFINPITQQPDWLVPKEWNEFVINLQKGIALPGDKKLQMDAPPTPYEGVKMFVHTAIFSGSLLLESGKSPYNHLDFPYIMYGAYKDEDKNVWFSAIEMMKDPQRALNTMRRQLSHLLQTAPKGILMHEVNTILNTDEYDKRSASPNFRMELARGSLAAGRIKFSDQPTISNIYTVLDQVYSEAIKNSSGIQDPFLGIQTSSREPGVTARLRLESNIAVLYLIFKNFRRSRIKGGKQLLSYIQQYVTTERAIRMEGPKGMQLVQINSQLNPQSKGFNDITAGKYDLEIDETSENVTMKKQIATMLMEYSQNNPGAIPPDLILDYMDVPLSAKTRVREYNEARLEREEQLMRAKAKPAAAKP